MSQDPSPYDLLQDNQISALQDIVTPYYQPPEAGELSFPIVGQGIDAEQYRLMSLAQGDGIVVTDDGTHSHTLVNLPGGAAETNARNQLVLQVARNTGRGEAILGGAYHVFYEDMILDFPPVSVPTTYHVCITRDPREEENPDKYLKVEVYAGEPPTANGRTHIVLHEVHREPNQLLTEAVRRTHRQAITPTITVSSADQLPDATTVLHHTLGVVRNKVISGSQVEGTGQLYEARGTAGWRNLLVGPWRNVGTFESGWNASYAKARHRAGGIDLVARGDIVSPANALFQLPSDMTLKESFYEQVPVTGSSGGATTRLSISADDLRGRVLDTTSRTWVNINVFIPDHYLA